MDVSDDVLVDLERPALEGAIPQERGGARPLFRLLSETVLLEYQRV